jgi:hypothetical protein
LKQISIDALSRTAVDAQVRGLGPTDSPQGTAAFFLGTPTTTEPGPWSTTVYIRGNAARPISLAVRFSDHGSGGVRAQWLNEKLLFLQVWRGRIVSTDLILDIETQKFVYQESANYAVLILPCDSRPRKQ